MDQLGISKYHALAWDLSIDNFIFCKLLIKYGYSNIKGVLNDQIWALIHPKTLAHIEIKERSLKAVVKQIRNIGPLEVDQVFEKAGLSIWQRQGRVRVL